MSRPMHIVQSNEILIAENPYIIGEFSGDHVTISNQSLMDAFFNDHKGIQSHIDVLHYRLRTAALNEALGIFTYSSKQR